MRSLQRRVIVGGIVWAVLATLIGGFALSTVFDQIADRRFNDILRERHVQVVVALGNVQSPDEIETLLTEPAYQRTYSGRYWQISGDDGAILTSPSLFDAELPRAASALRGAMIWEGNGPFGAVRGLQERITLGDGSVWTVSVAESLEALEAERSEMRRSVAVAFGFVGLLGVASAALLTTVLVAPLRRLGNDVRHRWDSGNELSPDAYPTEVAPLVTDINELIARNHDILKRGRRQAADLAHALKTPSAAMRNHLTALDQGAESIAPLVDALDRIDGQIARSLARMRAATAEGAAHFRTDVRRSVERMERLFRSLPEAEGRAFEVASVPATAVIDAQDLEEILGNLLENAFKWCRDTVALSVEKDLSMVRIRIEDDGPGIAEAQRKAVLQEGTRLDTSVPGTGLGLSITNDLANAYGGGFELGRSERLGGLCCLVSIPRAISGAAHAPALAS